MHLQAPPNLSDDLAPLLAAGIDDWGGVSPRHVDHVNPERPWPALERLQAATEAAGFVLAPRLTVYPEYVQRSRRRGSHPDVRTAVLVASDSEGLARDGAWSPGRDDLAPPPLIAGADAGCAPVRAVGEVLDGVLAGEEVGVDEIVTLLGARGPEVAHVAEVADELAARDRRRRGHVRPQPQHQLHERLHVQVPVLRVLEGAALAEPARQPVSRSRWRRCSAAWSKRSSAARPRCACRAGSIPTSTATTTSRSRAP